jgi:uncharacterized protein YxjI
MKKMLSIFALSMTLLNAADKHDLNVYEKEYRFSTVFEMESKGHSQGAAVKSVWRWLKPLRDTYDIYDETGSWIATGIGRIFCFGFFRPWGAEFDVYDINNERIGVIDGQVVTAGPAKFSFYNAEGKHTGTAYMDLKSDGFCIFHPEKPTLILVNLRRNVIKDQTDYWSVTINDEEELIDPRILKVFAAFAVDKQAYFKADN